MSWSKLLKDASYKGLSFEVLSTQDPFGKALSVTELPYVDGADVGDLGMKARRVQLQALFRGDDYEDRLEAFLAVLATPGEGVLVHPIFGPLERMVAESWPVTHDPEAIDSCRIQLSFVQNILSRPVFSQPSAVSASDQVTASAESARAGSVEAVVPTVSEASKGGFPRITALRSALGQAKAQLKALTDTTGIRAVLADLDPIIHPRAWAQDMITVVDVALQGLPFGGRNLLFKGTSLKGSGIDDFDRVATTLAPQAVTVLPEGTDQHAVADAAVIESHAKTVAASGIVEAASIVLAGEIDEQLLTRQDIERVANVGRAALQDAITSARSALGSERGNAVTEALAAAAFNLQEAARAAIELRPPVVVRVSPIGSHLRLVAHQFYGDHTRAVELVRLNHLGRKVLVDAGDQLNAYAQ
jgi:prophage DNA circulation protein